MTITRDGVPIATISTYTTAVVESDLDKANLKVTGDVSKVKGELGYLQLVWDFPKDFQTGEYECTAAAITKLGHFVTFTKSLEVQRSNVDLQTLIKEISDLKQDVKAQNITDEQHMAMLAEERAKNEQLQKEVKALNITSAEEKAKNEQLQKEVKALNITSAEEKAKNEQLQKDVNALNIISAEEKAKNEQLQKDVKVLNITSAEEKAKNEQLQKEVDSLKSDMQESKHVETGTVDCGSSYHWPTGSGTVTHNGNSYYTGLENHVKGSFHSKFSSPPVVFLSTSYLVVAENHHVFYGIKVVNVTTEDFMVRCDTWNSDSLVQTLEVDWIAVPL